VYRHSGNGVCEYCFDKLRHKDPERMKELKRQWYERAKAAGTYVPTVKRREIADQWINRAEDKKIEVTPKIDNLLDNLYQIEAKHNLEKP
jgi:hypothetical protein